MTGGILGAALWFTGVQMVVGEVCPLCCTIHACGILGGLLAFGVRWWSFPACLLTIGVIALGKSPDRLSSSTVTGSLVAINDAELVLLNGHAVVKKQEIPRWGPDAAQHSVVVVTNYACPHCLRLLRELKPAMAKLPAANVYFLPVATNPEAAEAEAWMLAAWRHSPTAFSQVELAVIDGQVAVEANAVEKFLAEQAADVRKLLPEARTQLVKNGQLVATAEKQHGMKGFPQLWFADEAVVGMKPTAEKLERLLSDHFEPKPVEVSKQATEVFPLLVTPRKLQIKSDPTWNREIRISLLPRVQGSTVKPSITCSDRLQAAGLRLSLEPAANGYEATVHFPTGVNASAYLGECLEVSASAAGSPALKLPLVAAERGAKISN